LAWAGIFLFLLFTLLALLAVLKPKKPPKASSPIKKTSPTLSKNQPLISSGRTPKTFRPPKSPQRPEVAIIIDDMGQRPWLERKFFKLGLTLNFSFLPYAPFTKRLAREAHRMGFTVMIHIPMEAENGKNPGPGALKLFMTEKEIKKRVQEMIAEVPFASGANQHMGSLFSQDPLRMKWVLEILRKNGLFFVDSRTTPQTVSSFVAKSLKIPFAERGHFLDNSLNKVELEKSFEKMLAKARRKGRLIVIAHPHPQTLKILKEHRNDLLYQITLVPVQKLLEVKP